MFRKVIITLQATQKKKMNIPKKKISNTIAFNAHFVCHLSKLKVSGSLNKFTDFFRMGTFIDSTHMKL